jgi:hypothetical protein
MKNNSVFAAAAFLIIFLLARVAGHSGATAQARTVIDDLGLCE